MSQVPEGGIDTGMKLAQSRIGKKYKLEERSKKPKSKKKMPDQNLLGNLNPEATFEGEDFSDSYCVLA